MSAPLGSTRDAQEPDDSPIPVLHVLVSLYKTLILLPAVEPHTTVHETKSPFLETVHVWKQYRMPIGPYYTCLSSCHMQGI